MAGPSERRRGSTAPIGKRLAALVVSCSAASLAAAPQDAGDLGPLAARVGPSVVRLSDQVGGDEQGSGTGFFVREDGIVVTNHHVIEAVSGRLVAVLKNGRKVPVIGSLADDEAHDLAIVRLEGRGYPALELAPVNSIRAGQRLTLVGSPLGLDQSIATGLLSAIRDDFPEEWKKRLASAGRPVTAGPLVQHTVSGPPGASGSPLVDDQSRVVAVHHSYIPGTAIHFAAHSDAVRALLARTDLDSEPRSLGPNVRRNLIISAAVLGAVLALFAGLSLLGRLSGRRRVDGR